MTREVDMSRVTAISAGPEPAITPFRDVRRDWRRWSAVERVCATFLGGLWVVGVATAILAAHLL